MKDEWFPQRFGNIELEKFILKNAGQEVDEDHSYIHFFYCTPFRDHLYLQITHQGDRFFITKRTLQSTNLVDEGIAFVTTEDAILSVTDVTQSKKYGLAPVFSTSGDWCDAQIVRLG